MADHVGWRVTARAAVVLAVAGLCADPAMRCASAASMIDRSGRFAIQWWTADDGLPEGPLRGIAFAPDGSLYCAGSRAISVFDGVVFQPLPAPLADDLREAVGEFWSIGFDGDGRLWVQGRTAVARVDPGAWQTARDRCRAFAVPDGRLTGMTFRPDGRPLFVGPGVVLECDGNSLVRLQTSPTGSEWDWLYGGIDPGSGDLWLWSDFKTAPRLYRAAIPATGTAALSVAAEDADFSAAVITLGFGPSGPLALLPDRIAVRRDHRWERVMPALPDAEFRVSGKILETADHTVWISSHNGLLASRDGGIETAIEGLPGFASFTHQLVADRDGGIWAACTGGLLAVRRTTLHVRPLADCRAVCECDDGSLLVGVPGAVLRITAGDAEDAAPERIATLPRNAIPTAICVDAANRIWVGTQDSFVFRIRDGRLEQMTKPDRHFRELRSISGLVCDAAGRVWVGTSNGLAVHDARSDTFRMVSANDAPFQACVVGLAADADGGILAATLGSGVVRHPPEGATSRLMAASDLPGRKSIVMRRDSQGTLWVGGDRGLVRVAADGSLTRFTTATGLVGDSVRQIEEDGRGRLWVILRDGSLQGLRIEDLAHVAAGRTTVVRGVVYGALDGIGENECIGHVARRDAGGPFTVALSNGILRFDAGTLPPGAAPPLPPRVERSAAPRHAFRYSSPGIQWGAPPLFQTRLRGVDTDWSRPAADHVREYSFLPPGRHRFEVRTVTGETDREFPATALAVDVPTPWYRSAWALTAMACGVAALAAVVSREITRSRSRRRIAALERQQMMSRERARIARDIHDSIGAGLTRMALMSDLARRTNNAPDSVRDRLDTIYQNARGLARSVDEIVWAVNPRNDTVARFISYVVNDVEEFVRAGDLTLRLEAPDEVPPNLPLSTQARHHVCLAIREILQNILRHARATHVDFTIRVDDRDLTVIVRDDGVGFDPDRRLAAEQDGLGNMRSRMAEVGGIVLIESRTGGGTLVTLAVPLEAGQTAGDTVRETSNGQVNHAS